MAASKDLGWETCAEDDCIGVRLPPGGKCWAHADDQDLDAALKQLGEDGQLDARGVQLSAKLLRRILEAAPREGYGISLAMARFDHATFNSEADLRNGTFKYEPRFDGATFRGKANFAGAVFQDQTWFVGVTFLDEAVFSSATFETWVGFTGSTFHDAAQFTEAQFQVGADFAPVTFQAPGSFALATFEDEALFTGATFQDDAEFASATFQDSAAFHEATFEGWAGFDRVTFESGAEFGATFLAGAWFGEAVFKGGAWFGGARFVGRAEFDSVIFEQARMFGPLFARELVLDNAVFRARVQIEVVAATLCARRAQFPAGVQFRLRWASVTLDDADLAAPAILVGAPPFDWFDEEHFARRMRRLPPVRVRDGRPRLLSLRRADVAGLTVSNVDLRACRFLGAHNLDKLRVEGNARFGFTRSALVTSRQTIAEEHHWRIDRNATSPWAVLRRGWYPAHYRPPGWLEVETVVPAQVAGLYRSLRKGREDAKDEPGAADFYYGEMEMRRHARREQARQDWRERNERTWAAAQTERTILWLYWLVSGYGLRAWRALATFLAVLVVAASLFAFGGGFASSTTATAASPSATTLPASTSANSTATIATADTSFGGALVFSARTVIGLTRTTQPELTRFGDVVQILLRILGPVLLGLAVLSVRGRVKR
jgi:uncharacterized protein YjbI with pentapeptide repeats